MTDNYFLLLHFCSPININNSKFDIIFCAVNDELEMYNAARLFNSYFTNHTYYLSIQSYIEGIHRCVHKICKL